MPLQSLPNYDYTILPFSLTSVADDAACNPTDFWQLITILIHPARITNPFQSTILCFALHPIFRTTCTNEASTKATMMPSTKDCEIKVANRAFFLFLILRPNWSSN